MYDNLCLATVFGWLDKNRDTSKFYFSQYDSILRDDLTHSPFCVLRKWVVFLNKILWKISKSFF